MTSVVLKIFVFLFLIGVTLARCPEGSIEGFDGDVCYLFERFPAQFITAERLCRDSKGHLASISDLFVNDFIAQTATECYDVMQAEDFWVGGNDLEKQNNWEWIDGAEFKFTNWAENEPVEDLRSFCLAPSLPQGLWYAKNCYEAKPYVCAIPPLDDITTPKNRSRPTHGPLTSPILRSTRHHRTRTPPKKRTTTLRPSRSCETGWDYLNSTGLCYKIVKDAMECYRPNRQEASIHSKEENNFIGNLAQQASSKKGNVKVRLSVAHYRPSDEDQRAEHGTQVKPWLMPHSWGLKNNNQRRRIFEEMRNNKHRDHNKSSSSEEKRGKGSWTWFDGTQFDYQNWAKNEPRKFNEFTCAQLNTCYKDCKKQDSNKFIWSSTKCNEVFDYAVCSQSP